VAVEDCIRRSFLIYVNAVRIIKFGRMRLVEHVECMKMRNAYKILVGKSKGKRPCGRPRYRWSSNIKINFNEM
jgi:hypothetical protein